ncbi:hypothetical protein ACWGJP_07645 [Microbacterium sp. NPDC055903]
MPFPPSMPHAVFTGALGDPSSGAWFPAQAVVSGGLITLWVASAGAWTQVFSVPAGQVQVRSAAQRITLVVGAQSYPILADPASVYRALNLTGMGIAGDLMGSDRLAIASGVGRAANVAGAAQAFTAGGGTEFLAAARFSGARVSRFGYGAIIALGCGGGLAVVIATLVITVLLLNL